MIQPFTPTTVMVAILRIFPAAIESPEILRSAAGRIFIMTDARSLSSYTSQGNLAERAGRLLREGGVKKLSASKPSRASEAARSRIDGQLKKRYPMFNTFTESLEEVTVHALEAWHRDGRGTVIPSSCIEEGMLAYHREIQYCSYLDSLLRRSAISV